MKWYSQGELCDDKRLYDSTFLSKRYDDKYKKSKKKWKDLSNWSSVTPRLDELKAIHSRFIDKTFFGFDESDYTNKSKNTNSGNNTSNKNDYQNLSFK